MVYVRALLQFFFPSLTFIQQMANVHPWFANVSVEAGPQWTWDFFNQTDVTLANSLPNKPSMSIAETGWPTVGNLKLQYRT